MLRWMRLASDAPPISPTQLAEDVAMRARLSERAAAVTEARARLESTRSRLRVAEELVA